MVRDYKGKNASAPVYRVDTALMAELRAGMRQAAEELGQWVTKSEPSHLNVNEMTERLNAGRRRMREEWWASSSTVGLLGRLASARNGRGKVPLSNAD